MKNDAYWRSLKKHEKIKLAKQVGVTLHTLGMAMNGRRALSEIVAKRVVQEMGVNADESAYEQLRGRK